MTSKIQPLPNINPAEIARKGEEIYQRELKAKFEKTHFGKYIAIEVDSGEYFLGENQIDVSSKAKKKFPDKITYLIKIGYPAVVTMSHHFKPPSYGSIFR